MGVSVESDEYAWRIRHLQEIPALVRFISVEPLLGPVSLRPALLRGIHWVIVGGESGPQARPMNPSWARNIRQQCLNKNVPFFFKQWGTHDELGQRVGKKKAGRVLDGRTWDQFPAMVLPV